MKVAWESIQAGTQSVRLMRLRLPSFAGALHAHEALELTWIERGEGVRIVGSRVEPFAAGDLVLIGPGLPHVWSSHGMPPEGAWATVLQWMPSASLAALPEWRGIAPLLQRAQRGLSIEGALRTRIVAALERMPEAPGLRMLGETLSTFALLADADGDLRPLDPLPFPVLQSDPGRQRRLDALLVWIREHLQGPLSVEDAAAILHVSPGAFSRSFHRIAGKPFTDYVNDLRIAEACMLLRQKDRSIADIADRCGFGTMSHFNRQFKRRVGHTPREYRCAQ
ncbi:MAG: helix-turn-helix domain-containing protein [Xanthomonadaceae bacterium]|nr:helix-turn-helix domain-containing protein [Xanthomonadaceae bacterium]